MASSGVDPEANLPIFLENNPRQSNRDNAYYHTQTPLEVCLLVPTDAHAPAATASERSAGQISSSFQTRFDGQNTAGYQ
jgi:hypothetical protein